MSAPTLPLDLPEHPAPEPPVLIAVRCRFCRKDVGSDAGACAWRMCDACANSAEFSA